MKTKTKITKKENKMFVQNTVCRSACKKIIEEVVGHFESSEVENHELWEAVIKKYDLDPDLEYSVNTRSMQIRTADINSETEKIIRRIDTNSHIKSKVEAIFFPKKKVNK